MGVCVSHSLSPSHLGLQLITEKDTWGILHLYKVPFKRREAFTTKWSNNIKIGEQIPMIVQYKMSIESWMVMYFQNVLVRDG